MTHLPSGTVTFLFTDIEGSTKLAREHPETWEIARSRHHQILREAIESNNGYVFQIIGDAFCAAHGDGKQAVFGIEGLRVPHAAFDAAIHIAVGIVFEVYI